MHLPRLLLLLAAAAPVTAQQRADALPSDTSRPNVLWIYVEDTNDWMSCYGDGVTETPNIDALAATGTRFTRAYMPAGVCSPTRSAIITGMHQTSIGAHQHYSSFETWRGIEMTVWDPNYLGVRTIPEILRLARYHTFNEGKLHYNFVYDIDQLYDHHSGKMGFVDAPEGRYWNSRTDGRPFFGQIQLAGGKARAKKVVDRAAVPVPPYYPDHPDIREAIANHYDTILNLDAEVGRIVAALKDAGLYENTVIVFFSDHGMSLMRHKQFLYEGGIRVPCIIAGPGIPAGAVRDDLIGGIDLSATTLALAGVNLPPHTQGRDVFAPDYARDHWVAARDRCDYTIDRIRAVVTQRYKYLRNFMTDRPYLQPQYRDGRPELETYRRLFAEGQLNEVEAAFASPHRPAEELYDLAADPHETVNLVHDPRHAQALGELRTLLDRWIVETNDLGRFPESDEALQAAL
ncbi:MAG: sulfatase, partial [Planctomycetota bacterium]|nr:sulfatase [Planctomycetota bacterium]